MHLLQINNLTKAFGEKIPNPVLNNLNLQVKHGEFIALMGTSGSGKSTLLNMISTADTPTTGEIIFSNANLHHLKHEELAPFLKENLGLVFHHFHLFDTLTIEENILFPFLFDCECVNQMKKKLSPIAQSLGVDHILPIYLSKLPNHYMHRIAIAKAILHSPSLLLTDEPTKGLDAQSTHAIMSVYKRINIEHKLAILMTTQDIHAASYCDRVIFIQNGKIYHTLNQKQGPTNFHQNILDTLVREA